MIRILCVCALAGWTITTAADDLPVFHLVVKDAKFSPTTVEVPVGKKFKLEIENQGPEAEEFESIELNREKVVAPGRTITVFLGPLGAGKYAFFGDFHRDTARGQIVAKVAK